MDQARRLVYTFGLVALIILGAMAPRAALAQLGSLAAPAYAAHEL